MKTIVAFCLAAFAYASANPYMNRRIINFALREYSLGGEGLNVSSWETCLVKCQTTTGCMTWFSSPSCGGATSCAMYSRIPNTVDPRLSESKANNNYYAGVLNLDMAKCGQDKLLGACAMEQGLVKVTPQTNMTEITRNYVGRSIYRPLYQPGTLNLSHVNSWEECQSECEKMDKCMSWHTRPCGNRTDCSLFTGVPNTGNTSLFEWKVKDPSYRSGVRGIGSCSQNKYLGECYLESKASKVDAPAPAPLAASPVVPSKSETPANGPPVSLLAPVPRALPSGPAPPPPAPISEPPVWFSQWFGQWFDQWFSQWLRSQYSRQ